MTTTPTVLEPEDVADPAEPAPLGRGSLFRAEAHRFRSRRFIRWILLLSLVGYLIAMPLIAVTQFSKPNRRRARRTPSADATRWSRTRTSSASSA